MATSNDNYPVEWLKDKNGDKFYPITHMKSIVTDDPDYPTIADAWMTKDDILTLEEIEASDIANLPINVLASKDFYQNESYKKLKGIPGNGIDTFLVEKRLDERVGFPSDVKNKDGSLFARVGQLNSDLVNSTQYRGLTTGTDILAYANSKEAEFVKVGYGSETVRILNAVNSPSGSDNSDYWYDLKYLSATGWIKVIAHDVRSGKMYVNSKVSGVWTGWKSFFSNENLHAGSNVGQFTNGVCKQTNKLASRPKCGVLTAASQTDIIMTYNFDASDDTNLQIEAKHHDGTPVNGALRYSCLFI